MLLCLWSRLAALAAAVSARGVSSSVLSRDFDPRGEQAGGVVVVVGGAGSCTSCCWGVSPYDFFLAAADALCISSTEKNHPLPNFLSLKKKVDQEDISPTYSAGILARGQGLVWRSQPWPLPGLKGTVSRTLAALGAKQFTKARLCTGFPSGA